MIVKTGSEIKNFADIENLVVSLIFRMENNYTQKDILSLALKYLDGCEITYSKFDIEKIIDAKLDLLQRYNHVTCCNGKYNTMSVNETMLRRTNLIFSDEEKLDLGILE